MLQRTNERGNRLCFGLFAWFPWAVLLAGIAKTATSNHATSAKHLVSWDWSGFKC